VIISAILIVDLIVNYVFKRILKPNRAWISILCFWLAYILTRPLGASIGDWLTADRYPSYDPTNCHDIGANSNDTNCQDPDVFCITSCSSYENCTDSTLTCPPGPNTCLDLQPTCYTPLACDKCWGFEGIMQTNIAFAVSVVVVVTILAITRYD
jgi:hypothetical protein